MQYALIYYQTAADLAREQSEPEAYWGAWSAYMGAMGAAGIMRGGAGLKQPPTATTLRIKNGEWQVEDGPFADTKEMLGGFVVIEVDDLDAALAWAARAPCAVDGSVEVRPTIDPDQV
ncbi:YciI family protein [Sandarakinorhabdus oryzae]|uniref:YciI family protein n=1 Tax=Sandarakinorhabdus oryzae TaxID=2675220 RepID=UPI0012E1CD6D|nr:YciI family protein [Sandarakinorhabdus oryzae]